MAEFWTDGRDYAAERSPGRSGLDHLPESSSPVGSVVSSRPRESLRPHRRGSLTQLVRVSL